MSGYLREIILIILLVLTNAFFSASEIALVTTRSSQLRARADSGDTRAKRAIALKDNPDRFLATIQIGITLAGFLASATAAVSISEGLSKALKNVSWTPISKNAGSVSLIIVTVIISYLSLVLGELVPKRMALRKAQQLSLFASGPLAFISRLAAPFVFLLTASSNVVIKLLGGNAGGQREQDFTEDEIRTLVTENRNLREDEKEMIAGVLEFKDTLANEIMVPRTDIIGLPDDTSVKQAIHLFKDTGLSRIPVFNGTLDSISGVLTVKDLLPALMSSSGTMIGDDVSVQTIGELARPAYHVPETKKVTELLAELKSKNIHMAILVDEYGGTAGLVTLEDLIEEIVGEIRDEFDPKSEEHFTKLENGEAEVDGIYSLEELNSKMRTRLPLSEGYETVGGFILAKLGRIPKVGDEVAHKGWVLRIKTMEGHRITKVLVQPEANS